MAASHSPDSSPDPLSQSIDRLYPASSPTKYPRNVTPHRTLRESSPNISSRHNSPSKSPHRSSPLKDWDGDVIPLERGQSVVLSTPGRLMKDAGASPWKIRLTVEADPEGNNGMYDWADRTTTITVPLKGEDEHRPVKRRVRRRKSIVTSSANREGAAGLDADVGRKSSARKPRRVTKSTMTLETSADSSSMLGSEKAGETPTNQERAHRSRSAHSAEAHGATIAQFNLQKPQMASPRRQRMDFSNITPLHQKQDNIPHIDNADVAQFTPWEIRRTVGGTAAKKIRERVPTPRKPAGWIEVDSSPMIPPSQDNEHEHSENLYEETMLSFNVTGTARVLDDPFTEQEESDGGEDLNDMSGLEDDTTMLDRSAIESEGFSMVSVDSLRNNNQQLVNAGNIEFTEIDNIEVVRTTSAQETTAFPQRSIHPRSPPPSSPLIDESVPGLEPPATAASAVADSRTQVSTTTMNAPRTNSMNIGTIPHTDSQRIEHQDAKVEQMASEKKTSPAMKLPPSKKRKSDEGVFDAFGTNTKRQLRAGLNIGELLARNDRGYAENVAQTGLLSKRRQEVHGEASITRNSGLRPRLPTPAASVDSDSGGANIIPPFEIRDTSQMSAARRKNDRMQPSLSSSPFVKLQEEHVSSDSSHGSSSLPVHEPAELDRTQILERQYQEERAEVIRQAQAANTSQVIVIDSDYPDGENDDMEDEQPANANGHLAQPLEPVADIWREEANRSFEEINDRDNRNLASAEQTPDFSDLFLPDLKPGRGRIPRTWRKVSGNDFHYSDELQSPVNSSLVTPNVLATVTPVPSGIRGNQFEKSGLEPQRLIDANAVEEDHEPVTFETPYSGINFNEQPQSSPTPDEYDVNGESDNDEHVDESYIPRHGHEEAMDATFYGNGNFEQDLQTPEPSELQTSDVRQIKSELKGSVRFTTRKPVFEQGVNVMRNVESTHNILQPKPGKSYGSLFEEPREPVAVVSVPVETNQQISIDNAFRSITNPSHPQPSANSSEEVSTSKPGILSRLTAWIFPRASTASPLQALPHDPSKATHIWDRNHYLLLDHYHNLSLSFHDPTYTSPRGPPLPPAYHTTLASIPISLTRHLHRPIATLQTNLYPRANISERQIRVAHAFISTAYERGIPLLCDGRLEGPYPSMEAGFPKRGPDGHVLRVKQDWHGDEWAVLRYTYALWTRDSLAGLLPEEVYALEMDEESKSRFPLRVEESRVGGRDAVLDEALMKEVKRRTQAWVRDSGHL